MTSPFSLNTWSPFDQHEKMDDSDNTQQLNGQDSRVLAREFQARNQDLTEEDAENLADEISREAIENLVSQGKIKFAPEGFDQEEAKPVRNNRDALFSIIERLREGAASTPADEIEADIAAAIAAVRDERRSSPPADDE